MSSCYRFWNTHNNGISNVGYDTCNSASCCGATAGGTCCTSSNKCNVGEGDCDHDSDCVGDLICGANNCAKDQPSKMPIWNFTLV